MSQPSLVVFGSQTTWPSPSYLSQIRESLLSEPRLDPLVKAIRELPSLWQILLDNDSTLRRVPGLQSLQQLQQWIDQGRPLRTKGTPPNVLLTPLTVIIHIAQYLRFIDRNKSTIDHSSILESVKPAGIQGLCTGILSAITLACAQDEEQVIQLSTAALRLAACIGAIVDLDGLFAESPSETSCVAIRYKDETGLQKVRQILQNYPEVYHLFYIFLSL